MKNLSVIQKRQLHGIQVMSFLLVLFSYVFYFNSKKVEDITLGFVIDQEWQLINEWVIASRSGSGLFLLLALTGIALAYLQFRSGKQIVMGSFVFGFGIIMAFLCWTASGKFVPFT
jgi:simple sugar transport system permease protein